LIGLGLSKGDRVCILAYNCVEWMEIYTATAMAGLIAVPINFRFVGPEIQYVVENSEASALVVEDKLLGAIESIRDALSITSKIFITFGGPTRHAGYRSYEDLIAAASDRPPAVNVAAEDPWTLMYTSGTTGKPKGAIRSHRGSAMLSLVTEVELGFSRHDSAMLVMPMCHANSLYFFSALIAAAFAPSTVGRVSIQNILFARWPKAVRRSRRWCQRISS
jgi:acyl-CoA synthetase (AMP-forming)/AMP-acid ligase II